MPETTDTKWRRLKMGLRTVTGVAREGFFIPHRHAGIVPRVHTPYAGLGPVFGARSAQFAECLRHASGYADALMAIDGGGVDRARWDQYWCPRLDGAMAYTMVRHLRPGRIIEIGSGHSTRFMARAIQDGGLDCTFSAIDPAPRAVIENLPVTLYRNVLQNVDRALFGSLEAGDFLCVDSSHILMPGTDVDIVLNRILPQLSAGVIVYFHDIFLPLPYPQDWAWRNYNEQNAVGVLLQGGYELVFASHYVVTQMAEEFAASAVAVLPVLPGAHECGLWLRKE